MTRGEPIRIALLETAPKDLPGSMASYAAMLERALGTHAPFLEVERVRLTSGNLAWGARLGDLLTAPRSRLRRDYDVLHLLDGSQAIALAGLPLSRVLVTVHDLIPLLLARDYFPGRRSGPAARLLVSLNGRMLARPAALCAVSESTARDVRALIGRPVDVVTPLPLPRPGSADTGSRERGDGRRVVLHVGNNGFYKYREGVLRIFSRMLARDPSLRLLLIGPPVTPAMQSLIRELPDPEAVECLVDPSDADVEAAYSRASLLLFPSLYEGYGWPPLEAMRAGCPVVASNRASLPEVVGDAGVLHDPEDHDGFAQAALRVLADGELAHELAARGHARVAALTEADLAGALSAIYVRLAAGGR